MHPAVVAQCEFIIRRWTPLVPVVVGCDSDGCIRNWFFGLRASMPTLRSIRPGQWALRRPAGATVDSPVTLLRALTLMLSADFFATITTNLSSTLIPTSVGSWLIDGLRRVKFQLEHLYDDPPTTDAVYYTGRCAVPTRVVLPTPEMMSAALMSIRSRDLGIDQRVEFMAVIIDVLYKETRAS